MGQTQGQLDSTKDGGMFGANKWRGYDHTDFEGFETMEAWECVEGCPIRMVDVAGANAGLGRSSMGGGTRRTPQTNGIKFTNRPVGYRSRQYYDKGHLSRFFYCAKAPSSERWFYCKLCEAAYPMAERKAHDHNGGREHIVTHPTVKPLELMRYLVRLTRPPAGGTVLDPFAGTCSTGVASIMESRNFMGIDSDKYSCAIGEARMRHTQPGLEL